MSDRKENVVRGIPPLRAVHLCGDTCISHSVYSSFFVSKTCPDMNGHADRHFGNFYALSLSLQIQRQNPKHEPAIKFFHGNPPNMRTDSRVSNLGKTQQIKERNGSFVKLQHF